MEKCVLERIQHKVGYTKNVSRLTKKIWIGFPVLNLIREKDDNAES